jgi:hypothetical protein
VSKSFFTKKSTKNLKPNFLFSRFLVNHVFECLSARGVQKHPSENLGEET